MGNLVERRCEICRRADGLGRHYTQVLVRGERSCSLVAEDYPDGWILLCGQCHGAVHRGIESNPSKAGIQIEAVTDLLVKVEAALLGTPRRGKQK